MCVCVCLYTCMQVHMHMNNHEWEWSKVDARCFFAIYPHYIYLGRASHWTSILQILVSLTGSFSVQKSKCYKQPLHLLYFCLRNLGPKSQHSFLYSQSSWKLSPLTFEKINTRPYIYEFLILRRKFDYGLYESRNMKQVKIYI